jgi:hypothetical protein
MTARLHANTITVAAQSFTASRHATTA